MRLFANDKLRIKLPVNIVADRVFTVRIHGIAWLRSDAISLTQHANIDASQDIASQFTVNEALLRELAHLLGVSEEHFADRLVLHPPPAILCDCDLISVRSVQKPKPASEACLDDKSISDATNILFDSYRNL